MIWVEFWINVFAFCYYLIFLKPINRSSLIKTDSAALGRIFEASELRGNKKQQLETPLLRLELRFDHYRQFSPQEIKEQILIRSFHLNLQFQTSQILVNSLTHWLFALATVLSHSRSTIDPFALIVWPPKRKSQSQPTIVELFHKSKLFPSQLNQIESHKPSNSQTHSRKQKKAQNQQSFPFAHKNPSVWPTSVRNVCPKIWNLHAAKSKRSPFWK